MEVGPAGFSGLKHRPVDPPSDSSGLSNTSRGELIASRLLTALASLAFLIAACWELFGPQLAGHYASSAAIGISAENMLRWHIAGPVTAYLAAHPGSGAYYSHHPWWIFWTELPFVLLFGHRDFVCRLPAVLLSAATPALVYATGRALWRPAAGAVAAVAFVVLPITLAFAQFNALEVPVIAWGLLATWGFVRYTQTWRGKHLAISTVAIFVAMDCDWPALLLVAALLGFGLLMTPLRGPNGFEPVDLRRYGRQWVLWLAAALFTVAFYFVLFKSLGTLPALSGSYALRAKGNDTPLLAVLEQRRYWIELCFTPIAIALGKLALPLILGRLAWLRREREFVPLAWLVVATVQYVVFKEGADIHIFWPHYFAVYFALAMGAIVATLIPAADWLLRRARVGHPSGARAAMVVLALLPLAAILRDGLPALVYARGTGGRFNEKGRLIDSDGAKVAFLQFVASRIPPDVPVDMHEGMKNNWSLMWALGGRPVGAKQPVPTGPATDGHDVYLLDSRFVSDEVQDELARRFHIVAVGPFWLIRRSEPASPVEASSFVETEPSLWEWYFVSGTEPHREIVPDPFLTWELRVHLGQPAAPPAETPRTFEQRRIAHNVAVASGDLAGAARLEAALASELSPVHSRLDDGIELWGTRYQDGARPLLTLVVKAAGPVANDMQLRVRSVVLSPARFSTTMADPVVREVGLPLGIAPRRFHAGFLYQDDVPVRKRPGVERYTASLSGSRAAAGGTEESGGIEVLRLQ